MATLYFLAQVTAVEATAGKDAPTSLFDSDWLKGGILFLVLGILGFIAKSLGGMQEFRKNAVSEISMQMRENERVERAGEIPQPLEIKAHVGFTPLDKHVALEKQLDELKEQRRKDVYGLHVKIETGLTDLRKELSSEFAGARTEAGKQREDIVRLQAETTNQTRQLHQVQNSIENMPEKIARLLNK